jgi:16S rRNA (cytidine1402-2'-O)-methyltransferase
LEAMAMVFGDQRLAVIAREMTKIHEVIHHSSLQALVSKVAQDSNEQRGEIVLVIAGAEKLTESQEDQELRRVLPILLAELPVKQAVKLACELTGYPKNKVYQYAIAHKGKAD